MNSIQLYSSVQLYKMSLRVSYPCPECCTLSLPTFQLILTHPPESLVYNRVSKLQLGLWAKFSLLPIFVVGGGGVVFNFLL